MAQRYTASSLPSNNGFEPQLTPGYPATDLPLEGLSGCLFTNMRLSGDVADLLAKKMALSILFFFYRKSLLI